MRYIALEIEADIHLYPAPSLERLTSEELITYAQTLNEEFWFIVQDTEDEQLEFLGTLANEWCWRNWEDIADKTHLPTIHNCGPLG